MSRQENVSDNLIGLSVDIDPIADSFSFFVGVTETENQFGSNFHFDNGLFSARSWLTKGLFLSTLSCVEMYKVLAMFDRMIVKSCKYKG